MLRFLFCSFVAILLISAALPSKSRGYIQHFSLGFQSFQLGNPPIPYSAFWDPQFSALILVDADCGTQAGCPTYCSDKLFANCYCSLRCSPVTPQNIRQVCNPNGEYRYDRSKSRSYSVNNTEWSIRMPATRPLVGELITDSMRIFQRHAANISFVSTLRFDPRLGVGNLAILGLGSGAYSFVRQLFSAYSLYQSLLSISTVRKLNTVKLGKRDATLMTIGALDGARCANWRFVPNLGNESWVIGVDGIDFMGARFPQRFLINFSFRTSSLKIPRHVAERLLAERRISIREQHSHSTFFKADCRTADDIPSVSANLSQNFRWIWKPKMLLSDGESREGKCRLVLDFDLSWPFCEDNVISLGLTTLRNGCIGFDYRRNMIGIGSLRAEELSSKHLWPF